MAIWKPCWSARKGARVRLFNRVGGSGHDFHDTTLDDDATLSILAGTAPFAGSYRPEERLSILNGEDRAASGHWRSPITRARMWVY